MKSMPKSGLFLISLIFLFSFFSLAQTVETKEGVRLVHNGSEGKWGKRAQLSLEFIKTYGEMESEDDNVIFYIPADIAFDTKGNVYVLDSGNHRIQKFAPDGKYLATIGRQGQGPGEFEYPQSLAIDSGGFLYISDMGNRKIHVLESNGAESKTIQMEEEGAGVLRVDASGRLVMAKGGGYMMIGPGGLNEDQDLGKLLSVLNTEGAILQEFGEKLFYKDFLTNNMGNRFHFTLDKEGNAYIAFDFQNRIDKYSPEGILLWKADRKLNYDVTQPKKKAGRREVSPGRYEIRMPEMNRCASGVAVDEEGRVWVASLKRQLREDEQLQTEIRATMYGAGRRSMYLKPVGNTDVRKTDAFWLEVLSSQGELLGKLQLDHFVDDILINNGHLYILDKMRGSQYYEYKIIEN